MTNHDKLWVWYLLAPLLWIAIAWEWITRKLHKRDPERNKRGIGRKES